MATQSSCVKDVAQSTRMTRNTGRSQNGTCCAYGIEARGERLTQIGTQLVRFERQAANMLFENRFSSNAADPDGSRDRKRRRQSDDQPYGGSR
jgi:hypothetical protein